MQVLNIVHALVWDVRRRRLVRANRDGLVFVGSLTALVAFVVGLAWAGHDGAVAAVALRILDGIGVLVLWMFISWRLPR